MHATNGVEKHAFHRVQFSLKYFLVVVLFHSIWIFLILGDNYREFFNLVVVDNK